MAAGATMVGVLVLIVPAHLYSMLAMDELRMMSSEVLLAILPPSNLALSLRIVFTQLSSGSDPSLSGQAAVTGTPLSLLLAMQAFNIVSYLIVLVWMYATVYSGENSNEKTVRFVPSEHQDSRRGVWAGDTCVVRLTAVSKTYAIERRREGVPALRDVSVDVRSGQVLSVLGTGGAGSSTLLRIIAGLDPDYRGDVERDVGGGRRDVGYCPERIVLFPYMSAMEHALLFQNLIRQQRPKLRVQRRDRVGGVAVMGKLAAKAEIKSLLSRFGLWQVRRKPVSVLSCGIQRRLQIALAVLGDPTLVVLDQPVAYCDKETREAVRAEVLRLGGQGAVVMSTRCLEDAE
eukprot:gene9465-12141_t